jgi:hypothetical protein
MSSGKMGGRELASSIHGRLCTVDERTRQPVESNFRAAENNLQSETLF